MRGLSHGLKQLALIALILRALVPVGWMPGDTPTQPITICTVNGPQQLTPDGGTVPPADHHGPDQQGLGQHGLCPFAGAPHLAFVPEAAAILPPPTHAAVMAARPAPGPVLAAHVTPGSPRAPPLNA